MRSWAAAMLLDRPPRALLAGLLVLVTWLAYAPVGGFGFVSWDDPPYVSANPMVQGGLTPEGLRWAFGAFHASNWHPLTWLSHMLDVELFGLDAGRHHQTSLVLHALNACLCLLALERLGVARATAFAAAALFAVHPLRVESVAWIAERKDVLAGSAFFATLLLWAGWARGGRAAERWAALVVFALGLLAKPMLVTLPVVLLLLDRWPLERIGRVGGRALLVEKLPFVLLALASCGVTLLAQGAGGAIQPFERVPLALRLAHAPVALLGYARRFLWPSGLAAYYPHPALAAGGPGPSWTAERLAALAAALLVTVLVLRLARARPAPAVGWLWTLAMLAPVIGIVQVGGQALADRYAYLPLVGLSLALLAPLASAIGSRATLASGLVLLVGLAPLARRQVGFWRDTITLFARATEVTGENAVAATNLGTALAEAGRLEEARPVLERALALAPRDPRPRTSLGSLEAAEGRLPQARAAFEQALAVAPGFIPALRAHGATCAELGDAPAARASFERLLALVPGDLQAHLELGLAAEAEGRRAGAIGHYRAALAADPRALDAARALAWLLSTGPASAQERREALAWAERAAAAVPDADALDVLAAAQAASGSFASAAATQRRALELGGFEGAATRRQWLARYEAGRSLVPDAPDARAAAPDGGGDGG